MGRMRKAGEFSEDADMIPGLNELVAWMEETWGRAIEVKSVIVQDVDGTEIRMEPEDGW